MPRKPPTYTPREVTALKAADRVVARTVITGTGRWAEQEFYPAPGQSIRDKLAEIQAEIAANPALKRVALYVGGIVNNERMIANVPHNFIPEELA